MDPQANYDQLKSAVLGAQQVTSGDSPLGSFPELAKLFSSSFQLPVSQSAASAAGQVTGDIVQQQKAQAAAAAASSGGGSRSGGGGFKIASRPDGGFGFYAPDGSEISASQYAAATGKDISAVLKNSRNPIDIAFLKDYKQLNDYIKNKQDSGKNAQAKSAAQNVETQVRKLYGIQLHQSNPTDVVNSFIKAYPTIFGNGATYQNPVAPGFGSQAGAQGTNRLITAPPKASKSSPYGGVTNGHR